MLKNLVIRCKSEKEEKEVLEVLEQHGNRWSNGEKATKKSHYHDTKKGYGIVVCDNCKIVWTLNVIGYKNGNGNTLVKKPKVLTAGEFLRKYASKNCIVIYSNGTETIALNKATGEKAVAKCSPDDTYDFYTGARLAFDRLTKPPVKEVKRAAKAGEYVKIVSISEDTTDVDIKIGDILLIKTVEGTWAHYGEYAGQFLYESEYVVLEGYVPEKIEKKKPETPIRKRYNGKVVCIKAKFPYLTEGKIYEVVGGRLTYDDGEKSCTYFSFEDLKAGFTSSFIEIVE